MMMFRGALNLPSTGSVQLVNEIAQYSSGVHACTVLSNVKVCPW